MGIHMERYNMTVDRQCTNIIVKMTKLLISKEDIAREKYGEWIFESAEIEILLHYKEGESKTIHYLKEVVKKRYRIIMLVFVQRETCQVILWGRKNFLFINITNTVMYVIQKYQYALYCIPLQMKFFDALN